MPKLKIRNAPKDADRKSSVLVVQKPEERAQIAELKKSITTGIKENQEVNDKNARLANRHIFR